MKWTPHDAGDWCGGRKAHTRTVDQRSISAIAHQLKVKVRCKTYTAIDNDTDMAVFIVKAQQITPNAGVTERGAKKEKNVHKSKYLAIHANKCGPQDSLGIDYHWCGNGQGGTPNVELQFDPATGDLVGVVFIPKGARWGDASNASGAADAMDWCRYDVQRLT